MTGEPVFEVRDLTVRYGGVTAVDRVSFDLAAGQILGIIGPNGAGKTTLFDAISGFVPASGRVRLAGHDISEMTPERRALRRLGRSFQDARLFPSLTVAEALAVSFERHIRAQGVISTAVRAPWVRRSERQLAQRVDRLIEMMGLGAFRDKFVSELSTGSRRIVDLALLMAHEPLVLLLDEPSSGIAQRETEALGPLLRRIRDETGAGLLVIEHDMPLIRSISDQIMALDTGAVVIVGSPDEVLEDPRVVASYLGTEAALVQRSGQRAGDGRRPKKSTTRSRATKAAAPKAAAGKSTAAKATGSKATAGKAAAGKTAAGRTTAGTRARKATAGTVDKETTPRA